MPHSWRRHCCFKDDDGGGGSVSCDVDNNDDNDNDIDNIQIAALLLIGRIEFHNPNIWNLEINSEIHAFLRVLKCERIFDIQFTRNVIFAPSFKKKIVRNIK